MNKIIPYGRQNIIQEDLDAVSQALVGDYLTQGPIIKEFEEALSRASIGEEMNAEGGAKAASQE
jgi:dTDP-4-amino-4,6-dideoxygalactose transaminase